MSDAQLTMVLSFLTLVFNGVMAYLVMRLRSKVGEVEGLATTAATKATEANRKTEAQNITLSEIKHQTNGINDELRADRDAAKARAAEVQAKYEALLRQMPPKDA